MSKYQILYCDNEELASRHMESNSYDVFEVESNDLTIAVIKCLDHMLKEAYNQTFEELVIDYCEGDTSSAKAIMKNPLRFMEEELEIGAGDPFIIWIKKDGKKVYDYPYEI